MTTAQLGALLVAALGILITIGTLLFKGGKWVGAINQQLAAHAAMLKEHGSMLKDVRHDLRMVFRSLPSSAAARTSPLGLTELGERIAEALGAVTWAQETAEPLRRKVSGMGSEQLQEFCFTYVYDEYQPDGELRAAMRSAAYRYSVHSGEVLDVLALTLREELQVRVA